MEQKQRQFKPLGTSVYLIAVYLLGWLAAVRILSEPRETDWLAATMLVLMASLTATLKVSVRGRDPGVSLSFLFVFAAVTDGAPHVAVLAVVLSEGFDRLTDKKGSEFPYAFTLATAAIGIAISSAAHENLAGGMGLPWLAATGVAAMAYYATHACVMSAYLGLREEVSPQKIWAQRFLWTGLLFMLAPLGVLATKLMLEAETALASILLLAVIFAGFSYVKASLAHLYDERQHTEELAEIRQKGIEALAVAIESKDGSTAGHLKRVRRHALHLARTLGCSEKEIKTLELAAVLHDVGKVSIPDYILKKPDRLTDKEFQQIARHPEIGANLIAAMKFPEPVEEVVAAHHEHWDGSGYPKGLKEEEIPLLARILTVVDCFDALVSDRPYRLALSFNEATQVMQYQRGKIFDPRILGLFLQQLEENRAALQQEIDEEARTRKVIDQAKRNPVRQKWMEETGSFEVSPRRKTVERLLKSPDLLMAILNALEVLGADLHFEKGLSQCLSILARAIGCKKIGVFVREEDQYVLFQGVGLPEGSLKRLRLSQGSSVLSQLTVHQTPVSGDSFMLEVPSGPTSEYFGEVGSLLAAPLKVSDHVVGILVLASEKEESFDEEQTLTLNLVTTKLASTLLAYLTMQKIYRDAATDAATKLPNVRSAFEKLKMEVDRARRDRKTVGVLFMDIDGLKPVNDIHGHAAGDKLLQAVAAKLKECVRSYDFVGRIGGDEFLAILPGIPRDALVGTVQLVKGTLAQTSVEVAPGVYVQPSLSVGVSVFPADGSDAEQLVYISDQRMYEDKRRARASAVDSRGSNEHSPFDTQESSPVTM